MTESSLPTTTSRHELATRTLPPRRLRPWPNVLVGLAAIGAIVAAVLLVGPSSTTSTVQYRYVTVDRGVVQASESASGNLAPVSESDLNFKSSGILTGLYVSAGEHVHAGQLLAQIDPTAAQVALEEAQANLEAAQAKLAETEANPSGSSSSSTQSAPTESRMLRATDAFGSTGASGSTSVGSTATTGTTGSTGTSKAKSPTTKKKSTTSAQSSSTSAVTEATDQANIASAEAAVSSDELTVKTDQQALDGTKLYAPSAGTIASISGAVGDEVSAGSGSSSSASADTGSGSSSTAGAATSSSTSSSSDSSSSSGSGFVVLANLSTMQLVVSVSEADIGTIKVGEPATVSVDALPDEEFAAKVTAISVLSTDSSGVVSYNVTLNLTQGSSQLRPGMSATATIISKQVNDAIDVESAAVSSAGTSSTVLLVKNGKTVETPVITGLVGTSATQIVAGLQPGQEVAIRVATSIATATGTSSSTSTGTLGGGLGGSGFAGGGFAGGGGGRFSRGG